MRISFFLCFSLFLVLGAWPTEQISITYQTDRGVITVLKDHNTSFLEISNQTGGNKAKAISSIQGLEKLTRLRTLVITYFESVDIGELEVYKPIVLKVQNSAVSRLSEILKTSLDALYLQSCRLSGEVAIEIRGRPIQYLEITNSGLTRLPKLSGTIPFVNYSFNNIAEVTPEDVANYVDCGTVLLLGNTVKTADSKFLLVGSQKQLVPQSWYSPQ